MATHSDLPPATEPAAQIGSTALANSAQLNHPSYAEMITSAILAMKEKDGSSRQAIARYIESEYNNLPQSHASLLTQQLRRMKNQGQLLMNKHSYMLAGSGQSQGPVSEVSDVPKRRPGRPPKLQSNGGGSAASVPQPVSGGFQASVGVSVPPAGAVVPPATSVPFDPIGAAPTMVPIGQVADLPPVKRRPGRPPKLHAVVVGTDPITLAQPISVGKKPGRPPKVNNGVVGVGEGGSILGKRGRGRPAQKLSSVSSLVGNGGGMKRGRGRPPRTVGLGFGQRPRGRPRKGVVSRVGTLGRPRGRPPKNASVNGGGVAAFVSVEGVEGAGRPSKMAVRRNPRKLSGKPLGRPKKDASLGATQASNNQQPLTAYQDLKNRVEHFQSRVKQAVDVVKPYLNDEGAAVQMLQEVEALALMDMSAPTSGQVTGPSAPAAGPSAPAAGPSAPPSGEAAAGGDPTAYESAQGQEPPNRN